MLTRVSDDRVTVYNSKAGNELVANIHCPSIGAKVGIELSVRPGNGLMTKLKPFIQQNLSCGAFPKYENCDLKGLKQESEIFMFRYNFHDKKPLEAKKCLKKLLEAMGVSKKNTADCANRVFGAKDSFTVKPYDNCLLLISPEQKIQGSLSLSYTKDENLLNVTVAARKNTDTADKIANLIKCQQNAKVKQSFANLKQRGISWDKNCQVVPMSVYTSMQKTKVETQSLISDIFSKLEAFYDQKDVNAVFTRLELLKQRDAQRSRSWLPARPSK